MCTRQESHTAISVIAHAINETHLWPVVEQPSHRDPLLVAARERVSPFSYCVPSALALDNMSHLYHFQDGEKICICDTFGDHLGMVVRVDELIAERAGGEIWSLRDVGELSRWRLIYRSP